MYCSITGFGQTGPYRERAGYDYAVQGMGGLMSVTGERDDLPGGGPQKVGVAVADLFTGMYATVAILAALRHRDATGEGQVIDMALLDTQVAMLANLGANYLVTGRRRRGAPATRTRTSCPTRCSRSPTATSSWPWATTASSPTLLRRGRLPRTGARRTLRAQRRPRAPPRHAGAAAGSAPAPARRSADWLAALEAAKVPCGPINDLAEVFADPQVQRARHDGDRAAPATTTRWNWWPAR